MTNQSEVDSLRDEHRRISEQLNIDASTEERSWNSFREIWDSYKLDGEPRHWLCCTLYVTCRQTVTPTVGSNGAVLQGNCVSLTKLLRLCGINLNEFFRKIVQWGEMASLPEETRNAIDNLQHRFAVSMSIYSKFNELFPMIFLPPSTDEQKRGKKSKPQPCSTNRLHEFCWLLFICAKGEYPEQSADVVASCEMLICCLDMIYANAIADGRRDIINPEFEGVPQDFLAEDGKIPPKPVCIVEALCEDPTTSKALVTKNTIWSDVIRKLFGKNVLQGDAESFMGLITLANFDDNLKAMNVLYDTYILSCGEFDERIALSKKNVENPLASRIKADKPSVTETPERIPMCPQTPLSGRSRISREECNKFTPISTANASVNKLRLKLSSFDGTPHESLKELFKSCHPDVIATVRARIASERTKFMERMKEQNWKQEYTKAKFDMIEALYYRLLENIVRPEMKRRGPNAFRQICMEDMFNKTLLVCSAEIVIYAHNLQQNFPWILKAFELAPFYFYRAIELVVLYHNDLLSRDVIKHLTIIEEQCLDSLIWKYNSPLWVTMDNLGYQVPTAQEVEFSADLSGITPHKPGESVVKTGSQVKLDSVGPRANLNQSFMSTLGFNSPMKLPVPNGSLSKQRPGEKSLNLFFRKFYGMAAIRMKHLCNNLGLITDDRQRQIWTIFEYSIVHRTRELMRDRHLDQMLMCAIYVFVKVTKLSSTFTDIMRYYRSQPQSNSHVYRSVFIKRHTPEQVAQREQNGTEAQQTASSSSSSSGDNRVAPAALAGVSMQHGTEERGDIILFYNTVYVQQMQEFAIQFGNVDERTLILSPPPRTPNRSMLQSPKQIDGRISLYVTPMERKNDLKESPNSITYLFDRSPAKELEKINTIVKSGTGCKRSLSDPDSYEVTGIVVKPLRKVKKFDRLLLDRQAQDSNPNAK